ncbi:MAG TPA: inositol 2-dehydrogenase [Chthonomonadaceae bacterium]|nr:inositol 2-dehydrogenase [Chthonomonadaceae bacterium]
MTETRPIRVGVIGAGRIGKIHVENLSYRVPGAALAAIADVNLPAAQEMAARFKIPMAVADYTALLTESNIDAVAICSPSDTHARLIVEAAQAGKHIFCEKPIDYELDKIDAALEAVSQAGVKLQVGFNRRFDVNFANARQMVAEGNVGDPHILRITSRDPEPPPRTYARGAGSIFLDMTIHDFDMARYLMGSEVEEVSTAGATLIDPDVDDLDTAIVTLTFANGALGAIDNSRRAVYGYDQRVEVFGSGGMVMAANRTPDTLSLSNSEGVHSAKPLYFFLERYTESFATEMRQFIECIRQDTPPPVTGWDGRMAVVIAIAAWKSYREKRPVRVSDTP